MHSSRRWPIATLRYATELNAIAVMHGTYVNGLASLDTALPCPDARMCASGFIVANIVFYSVGTATRVFLQMRGAPVSSLSLFRGR